MAYDNNENYYYGWIYVCKNDVNNLFYIGQTSNKNPYKRFNEHLREKSNETYFDKEINNIGKEHFYFETIKMVVANSNNELHNILDYYECLYIYEMNTLYPNGYNMTTGGRFCTNCNTTPYEYNNINIKKYNVFKEHVCTYESILSAAIHNNTSCVYILRNCLGEILSFEGNIYRFENDDLDKYPISIYGISQYDMDGNFIKRWNSCKECEVYYGFPETSVSKAIRRKTSTHGYLFSKYGEEIVIPKKYTKRVYQYNYDLELINVYEKIKDVMPYLGLDKSKSTGDVKRIIKAHNHYMNGYFWFIDDRNYKERRKYNG